MAKKKRNKPAKSAKPKTAKQPAAPRPGPAPRAAGGRIHFTCSECYEEFVLRSSQMQDTLTCPECLHVGKRPEDNFLMTVQGTKGREKRVLGLAMLFALLASVLGTGFVLLLSPHKDIVLNLVPGEMSTYVFGGGLALLGLVGIAMAAQYEKNRWEVYF